MSDVWTIAKLMEAAEKSMRAKEIEEPRLDTQILLAHVLTCPRIQLYIRSEEPASDTVRAEFRTLVRKRLDGMPVAYIVGEREFFRLSLEVSPAVLIPRPDTETLVLEVLELVKKRTDPKIVDVGTGSGAIALSLAMQHKTAILTAVDISADALEIARRNAVRHRLESRVTFVESDLFAGLPEGERFDVVASNPPYIARDEFAGLDREVRDHEPHLALDGGSDGLAVYRRLIPESLGYLVDGGWLAVEIGSTQHAEVSDLFERTERFADVRMVRDGAGHTRVIVGRKV